jgi:Tfp pilus assembly protein PilO
MKPRDRLVVSVLVAVAALAVVWLAVVSPKRQDASQLGGKLSVAQNRLGAAQAQLAAAKAAEAGYPQNLAVVKELYKAVPSSTGVPRLLVSLDKSSHYKRVDFKVITVTTGAAGSAAASATPQPGGLSPIGFTFTFNGGYIALQHFLRSVSRYTLLKGNAVVAHGRLLTIQSVALTPAQTAAAGATSTPTPSGTQAAVTATAYSQMPAGAAAPITSTTTASTPAAPTTGSAATVATTTTK